MKTRKAFSLIELMIVVIIMGLVYSMVNLNFATKQQDVQILGPKNIADFLRTQKDVAVRKFVIYGDACDQALFDPEIEELDIDELAFSKDIQVYKSDAFGSYEAQESSLIKVNDREFPLCFELKKYANESVDTTIVKNSEMFYYIDPFFGKTRSFKTLQETVSFVEKRALNPDFLGLRRQ